MEAVDPTLRLSPHFLLSDFLGNHSIYSYGLRNMLEGSASEVDLRLSNAQHLCEYILEPLVSECGPMSISYGYISPEVSRRVVKYQDPDKPSHHRWDLGAAADVCVHRWVRGKLPALEGREEVSAPIYLAHFADQLGIPYSRLITYSESQYLCLAASAREIAAGTPRKAFYENRFTGVPRAKPDYRTYSSPAVRAREFDRLIAQGLPADWQGSGYPTYHGGGREQYQHRRCSEYTMVSDWLFDLQSIANGYSNTPCLNLESVQDAFGAAGLIYDRIIDEAGMARLSIVSGYVSHLNPEFNPNNDWRSGRIAFKVRTPNDSDQDFLPEIVEIFGGVSEIDDDGGVWIAAEVEDVYAAT